MTSPAGEVLSWCLDHFEAMDTANAAIHLAPVRYSPITFRLAEVLADTLTRDTEITDALERVLSHVGAYEMDPGR